MWASHAVVRVTARSDSHARAECARARADRPPVVESASTRPQTLTTAAAATTRAERPLTERRCVVPARRAPAYHAASLAWPAAIGAPVAAQRTAIPGRTPRRESAGEANARDRPRARGLTHRRTDPPDGRPLGS